MSTTTSMKGLETSVAPKQSTSAKADGYGKGSYGTSAYAPKVDAADDANASSANAPVIGKATATVNFRSEPSTKNGSATVISTLHSGDEFTLLDRMGAWLHVKVGTQEGYLYTTLTDQGATLTQKSDAISSGRAAGLLGNIDDAKLECARYNPEDTMFNNVCNAVSAVETCGDYGRVGDIGDGAGLSVGGFQFTERYSLYLLVDKYEEVGGTVKFEESLKTAMRNAASKGTPLTSEQRKTVKGLLQEAYATDRDTYIEAQKQAWAVNYFNPCTERMKRFGLDPDTLDPRICMLIYDHENAGSGSNDAMLTILANRFGDGKKIDQSKLTCENVAYAIQCQFQQFDSYSKWGDGWNNRVMILYAATQIPAQGKASGAQTTTGGNTGTNAPAVEEPVATEAPSEAEGTEVAAENEIDENKYYDDLANIQKDLPAKGKWGRVLHTSYGVEVRSNKSNPDSSIRTKWGIPYQCVEFVNRFFNLALGYGNMKGTGNAKDYVSGSARSDLQTFEGGKTTEKPQPGDMLIRTSGQYGHVGICESVDGNTMHVAQQNCETTASVDHTLKNNNGKWSCDKWTHWRRLEGAAAKLGALTAPAEKKPEETKPAETKPEETKPVESPSTDKPVTKLDALLAEHPEIKTNQNLINYFYSVGGNTFNGAAAKAKEYAVDLNALCANRQAAVSASGAVAASKNDNQTTVGKTDAPVGGSTGGGAVAADGVPIYAQGDSQWGTRQLGTTGKNTIHSAGCAMCSTAMCLSKISGEAITPDVLDEYLDNNGGYVGDCIWWDRAANKIDKHANLLGMAGNQALIDECLNKGYPVVISVKNNGHYVCVAGKNADGTYIIHDPAGGVVRSGEWNGSAIKVDGYSLGTALIQFY